MAELETKLIDNFKPSGWLIGGLIVGLLWVSWGLWQSGDYQRQAHENIGEYPFRRMSPQDMRKLSIIATGAVPTFYGYDEIRSTNGRSRAIPACCR